MRKWREINKIWIVGALLSVGLLILASLNAAIIFLSLWLAYSILSNYISRQLFNSRSYRVVAAIVMYTVIFQAVMLVAWLFDHNFRLSWVAFAAFALFFICWLTLRSTPLGKPDSRLPLATFNQADLYSVILALIIVFLVLVGPIEKAVRAHAKIDLPTLTESYIDTSLDDSSHLSLLNDRLQLDRGVFYKTNVQQYVVHQNLISSYPAGWQSVNAAIIKAVDPNIQVGGQSATAYLLSKIFWLFILVYLFCRSITVFYIVFIRDKFLWRSSDQVWLVGAGLFFAYYILLEQFKEGFYNFIPVLICQLLTLVLLLQLGQETKSIAGSPTYRIRSLFPLSLSLAGAVLAWTLVAPAALFPIALAIYYLLKGLRAPAAGRLLWRQLRFSVVFVALAVLAVLIQTKVLTSSTSRTFSQGINDPGSITQHSPWYFGLTAIGLLLFFGLGARLFKIVEHVTAFIVGLLTFVVFIYMFQIISVHTTRYYFTKNLNVLMVLIVPIALVGWLMLIKLVGERYTGAGKFFLGASSVLLLPLVIGIDPINTSDLGYVKGDRGFSFNENAYMYNSMSARAKVPITDRQSDVIFYTPGQRDHNIVGTNIVRSIQPVDSCDNQQFTDLLNDNEPGLLRTIAACQRSPLTIVTNNDSYRPLVLMIKSASLNNKVKVVAVQ